MELILLGMNHRTAPVDVRERLDFSKIPPEKYLPRLICPPASAGGMVLSTCNRVEVYLTGDGADTLFDRAEAFLKDFHGLDGSAVSPYCYRKRDREAAAHLFRVAASLDSMVVGEPQVLGQVKEAYAAAAAAGTLDPFLERLCGRALSVAKRVRTQTRIARQAVSVGHAAVELARKIFGDLAGKRVLFLGAGEMVTLAARHMKRHGAGALFFANRSFKKAAELAAEMEGVAVGFDRWLEHLVSSDVILVSASAPKYLLTRRHLEDALQRRRQEPLFVIDISVPRNVEPASGELENVYLYNIDDLKVVVEANLKMRAGEVEGAEAIVDAEVERFVRAAERARAGRAAGALTRKYERLRSEETARLLRRLGPVPEEHARLIERTTSSLVAKILNRPILYLAHAPSEEAEGRERTLVEMFALDTGEPDAS